MRDWSSGGRAAKVSEAMYSVNSARSSASSPASEASAGAGDGAEGGGSLRRRRRDVDGGASFVASAAARQSVKVARFFLVSSGIRDIVLFVQWSIRVEWWLGGK